MRLPSRRRRQGWVLGARCALVLHWVHHPVTQLCAPPSCSQSPRGVFLSAHGAAMQSTRSVRARCCKLAWHRA